MALVSSFAVLRRRLRVYGTPRLRFVVLLAVVVGVVPRSASAITRRDFGAGVVPRGSSSALGPRLSRWKGRLQRMEGHPAFGTPSPMKVIRTMDSLQMFQQISITTTRKT